MTNTPRTKHSKSRAFLAGVAAFSAGLPCAPALDPEFGRMVAENPLPIGPESLQRLQDWHKGWAAANLVGGV